MATKYASALFYVYFMRSKKIQFNALIYCIRYDLVLQCENHCEFHLIFFTIFSFVFIECVSVFEFNVIFLKKK